jgi:hypothetical protein
VARLISSAEVVVEEDKSNVSDSPEPQWIIIDERRRVWKYEDTEALKAAVRRTVEHRMSAALRECQGAVQRRST